MHQYRNHIERLSTRLLQAIAGRISSSETIENWLHPLVIRLLIAVGFLGSYTTFSTYELDTEKLLAQERWAIASLYWLGSILLGGLSLEISGFLARKMA
jgi:CrcB protein